MTFLNFLISVLLITTISCSKKDKEEFVDENLRFVELSAITINTVLEDGNVVVPPSTLDFGSIEKGQAVSQSIIIYNSQTELLTLQAEDFIVDDIAPFQITANNCVGSIKNKRSCKFTISLQNPSALTESNSLVKSIFIKNTEITLTGELLLYTPPVGPIDKIKINPMILDFGSLEPGKSKELAVIITNNTGESQDWATPVVNNPKITIQENCGTKIGNNRSCSIKVKYTASVEEEIVGEDFASIYGNNLKHSVRVQDSFTGVLDILPSIEIITETIIVPNIKTGKVNFQNKTGKNITSPIVGVSSHPGVVINSISCPNGLIDKRVCSVTYSLNSNILPSGSSTQTITLQSGTIFSKNQVIELNVDSSTNPPVDVITYETVDTTPNCSSINLQICEGTQNINKTYLCEKYINGIKDSSYSGNACSPLANMAPLTCLSPAGIYSQSSIQNGIQSVSCVEGSSVQEVSITCSNGFHLEGSNCVQNEEVNELLPVVVINSALFGIPEIETDMITRLSVQSTMTDVSFYKGNDCNPANLMSPLLSFEPFSGMLFTYPEINIGINYVSAKGKVNGVDTLCGYSSFIYNIPDTEGPNLVVNVESYTTLAHRSPKITINSSDNKSLSYISYIISSIEYDEELDNESDLETSDNKYEEWRIDFDQETLVYAATIDNGISDSSVGSSYFNQHRYFPPNQPIYILIKACDSSYNCTKQKFSFVNTQVLPDSIAFYYSENLMNNQESLRDIVKLTINPMKLGEIRFGDNNQKEQNSFYLNYGDLFNVSEPVIFDASGNGGNYLSTPRYMDETICSEIGGIFDNVSFSGACFTSNEQACLDNGFVYVRIVSQYQSEFLGYFLNNSCQGNKFLIGHQGLNVSMPGNLSPKQKLVYDSLKFFDEKCIVSENGKMICEFPPGNSLDVEEGGSSTNFRIATRDGEVFDLNTNNMVITTNIAGYFVDAYSKNMDIFHSPQEHTSIGFGDEEGTVSFYYAYLLTNLTAVPNVAEHISPSVYIEPEESTGLFFRDKETLFSTGKRIARASRTSMDSKIKFFQKDLKKSDYINVTGRTLISRGDVTPGGVIYDRTIFWDYDINESASGNEIKEIPSVGYLEDTEHSFKCGGYIYVHDSARMSFSKSSTPNNSSLISFNGNVHGFPGMIRSPACDNGIVYWYGGSSVHSFDPKKPMSATNPNRVSILNSPVNTTEIYTHITMSKDFIYVATFNSNTYRYHFERVSKDSFTISTLPISYDLMSNMTLLSSITSDYDSNKLYFALSKAQNSLTAIVEYDPSIPMNYNLNLNQATLSSLNNENIGGGRFAGNNPIVLKAFPVSSNFTKKNEMTVVKNQLIYYIESNQFDYFSHSVRMIDLTTKEDKLLIPLVEGGSYQKLIKVRNYGNNLFILTNDNTRGYRLDWIDITKTSGPGSPGNGLRLTQVGYDSTGPEMFFDVIPLD